MLMAKQSLSFLRFLNDFDGRHRYPAHLTILKCDFFPIFHAVILNADFSTLMDDDIVSIDGTRGLVYRGVVRLVV